MHVMMDESAMPTPFPALLKEWLSRSFMFCLGLHVIVGILGTFATTALVVQMGPAPSVSVWVKGLGRHFLSRVGNRAVA